MVKVIDYALRENAQGEKLYALTLMGGVEMVKSKESGRYYATARKCSIPSTFDERTCQGLIGSDYPGVFRRVDCSPYDYTIQDTGEIIKLSHRWEYMTEEEAIEHDVHQGKVVEPFAE